MREPKTENSASMQLLRQLEAVGTPRGAIARHLDIQASAVTEMYAGRRQLKYDEGIALTDLLPTDSRARTLPILTSTEAVGDWESALSSAQESISVPLPITKAGQFVVKVSGGFLSPLADDWMPAVAKEATFKRATFSRPSDRQGKRDTRHSHESNPVDGFAVIDPSDRNLFVSRLYLLSVSEGSSRVCWYRSDPARFENVANNALATDLLVGTDEFRLIGAVTAVLQGF